MNRTDLRTILKLLATHPRIAVKELVEVSRMTNLHQAGLPFSREDERLLETLAERYLQGERSNGR